MIDGGLIVSFAVTFIVGLGLGCGVRAAISHYHHKQARHHRMG
jgi:hypothetical protein